jgi:hypothetical protein
MAQRKSPQAVDREAGLVIPDTGIVRRGQGQRVMLGGAGGKDVVALVHAEVGDRRLVILPDGRLDSVLTADTRLTDEPFRPATKEEIAAELKKRGFGDFKVRATAHFVYVYNTSDVFYNGTRGILETMYPAVLNYFKRLKLPVHHPEVPLVAVMFRTEEEFQKFDAVPPTIAAYYDPISNHVVMYEQSELVEVAPELAVKQAIGTIAHEGIHQILHNIGVQQRLSRWPMWVAEGLAEYFAPTTVDKRLRWKGIGVPNDLRMYELDRFMKARLVADALSGFAEEGQVPGLLARDCLAGAARAARGNCDVRSAGGFRGAFWVRFCRARERPGQASALPAVCRPDRQPDALCGADRHGPDALGRRDHVSGRRPPLAGRDAQQTARRRARRDAVSDRPVCQQGPGQPVCGPISGPRGLSVPACEENGASIGRAELE